MSNKIGNAVAKQYRRALNKAVRDGESSGKLGKMAALATDLVNLDVSDERLEQLNLLNGIRIPEGKGQPHTLMKMLGRGALKVLIPVCPPVPADGRVFLPKMSVEAKAGVRAAKQLTGQFADLVGVDVSAAILVADTETDLDPVAQRAGGSSKYSKVCSESAEMLADEFNDVDAVTVDTFSGVFGEQYHEVQYGCESDIRNRMDKDSTFERKMQAISRARAEKHALILGRPETDCELTVRYAAQYQALREIIDEGQLLTADAVCNYPTPNIQFYNGNPNPAVIPVFGSITSDIRRESEFSK